jgi:hypothetical protein
MTALLAINWEPQLRGIIIIIIAGSVLMGSVYVILATNMGARLGFLVAFAALAGWIFLMGSVWWSYGKGLLGPDAAWKPVAGQTVLQDTHALSIVGLLKTPVVDDGSQNPAVVSTTVASQLVAEHWDELPASDHNYQQAGAAGGVFLEDSGAFAAGEFEVVNVFSRGGQRSPQLFGGKVDFLSFFHKPHYALIEVAPLVVQRAEPGRAPAASVIDTTRPHQYIYVIRDLGAKREPAGFITVGSLMVFLVLCYLLHSRDKKVLENKNNTRAIPAKV